jgi:hypothetical protein
MVCSVLISLSGRGSRWKLEILILRHQLNIQRRHQPTRVAFNAMDRPIFVGLYQDADLRRGKDLVEGRRQFGKSAQYPQPARTGAKRSPRLSRIIKPTTLYIRDRLPG